MKMRKIGLSILAVIAVLATGCGGGSSSSTTPTAPSAPTGLTATAGNTQVALSWTTVSGATSYTIYYGTATGVTTANGTKISGITSPSYTQTGLTNGTPYYYIVTATNSGGESAASTQATATPIAPIPAAPAGLAAVAGNAQVALSWTAVSGATSYNVYYSTTSGVTPSNGTKISGVTAASYTHTGLTNGTPYYYVVTAVNSGGESTASSQVSATPVPPVPAAPTGLVATAGDAKVALSWSAATGATSYNIYYGTTSPVTISSGTKIGSLSGTSYTVTGLTNGTPYYFVVTAANLGGESTASTQASATPTNGATVTLQPGTASTGTVHIGTSTSLTFSFGSTAVTQAAVATISSLTQSALPTPLTRATRTNGKLAPMVTASDTFIAAFEISLNPQSIVAFNTPVGLSGAVDTSITAGATLNIAILKNGAWVDVSTLVVGANGAIAQNLPSISLAGMLAPGTYLIYKPASGTNTSVSNLGVVLLADDGNGMADGYDGLQVIHIYDASGNLLTTPTIAYLDYASAYDIDGSALTPDGSQGILVDGDNFISLFSAVQTGVPVASTHDLDISAYGGDGDSVAILPNGDEAVASEDTSNNLLVLSGILSGSPVAATTITVPSYRDGLVISNDGAVLLARGPSGATVFSVAPITPVAGSIGGTVSHSYTQLADFPALGTSGYLEDGRDGMAISPADPTRAVIVTPYAGAIQLLTGLKTTPVAGAVVTLPSYFAQAVCISPDGKLAIVGTDGGGLLMYSGVDTGNLTLVGSAYSPSYKLGANNVTLSGVSTLGITLDGKYVVVGDSYNRALVVIPFTSSGFGAPASALGSVGVPANDQLLIH